MTPDPSSGQPDAPGSKTPESADVNAGAAGAPSGLESPGRAVRHARERAQMGIEELAAQTKLARSTLEALEADDFKQLSEAVYVQGYYRKCAKVLGLSETDLIAAYRRLGHPGTPRTPSKLLLAGESSELIRGDGGRGGGWWIALIVIIIIAVAVWYVQRYTRTHNVGGPASADTTGQVVTPTPTVRASPRAPEGSGAGEGKSTDTSGFATQLGEPVAQTGAGSAAAGKAQAQAQTATAAPPAATSTELKLQFASTSWVRINDSTGALLLSGVIQAGERKVLDGVPPYSVFLGNAPGVKLYYHGKQLSIASLVESNSTARFSVPMAH